MKSIHLTTRIFLCTFLFFSNASYSDWQYHFGTDASTYDYRGIPLNLGEADASVSDALWAKISSALPESRDIRLVNPDYITDDDGANITLIEEGELFVTFLHEGAGYKNSIGYFTYTGDHPTSRDEIQEIILLPNTSYNHHGGSENGLYSGNRINLGTFPVGTKIGFVVSADGWDGSHGVRHLQSSNRNFYTIKSFNAENDDILSAHTVMLHDDETDNVILGFEDINRTYGNCDQDFNDVVLMLDSNPSSAIDYSQLEALPEPTDQDGDGILDANDDYPDDAERAFNHFYPSQDRKGTLAYEDLWPAKGDYDFNDLVVSYQMRETVQHQGLIKDIKANFEILARGAAIASGFSVAFDNINPGALESATLSVNGGQAENIFAEPNQDRLVIKLFSNSFIHTVPAADCLYFNTQNNCGVAIGDEFELILTFSNPQQSDDVGSAPYNPYIWRANEPGREVHLADHSPTFQADSDFFGELEDDTSIADGRYYKTPTNLPWALDISYPWCHPKEHKTISNTYLLFNNWAESSGAEDADWYSRNTNDSFLYNCQ